MKDYKRSIDINTTYGILYRRMFENVGFRMGITKTNLSYSTRIPNNNNQFITDYSNIALKENITRQSINSTFNGANEIKLKQHLSYYEIPIELYKSFTNKKSDFGFAIFLGITPQFLDKNNLALESSTIDSFEIGKASNLRNVNVGFHAGLGLNYKFTEKFQFDLNPIFKLQSVPYEDYHDFLPYYIAIQSGLSYKF
ncbi:MAG: hypothetical protein HC854_13940 [Flavobacterium sp.]|nr:hypothetical protein [Flavobacterium sp.]